MVKLRQIATKTTFLAAFCASINTQRRSHGPQLKFVGYCGLRLDMCGILAMLNASKNEEERENCLAREVIRVD